MGMLSSNQIADLGLAAVGEEVQISDRCSIYGASAISIGSHVRIDDFAIITARAPVIIGSYVHISAFAFISGQFGIDIGDFCNVGIRVTLLSTNDDFSGEWLPGAVIPLELRSPTGAPVVFDRHVTVGSHTVVLPGVRLAEGVAVGALSLVKSSLPDWGIYAGIPARRLRERKRNAETLSRQLMHDSR